MGGFGWHGGGLAKARDRWCLAIIFAALISNQGADAAAAQAGGSAVPSDLPLERYERIVPFRNGCNAILRLGELDPVFETRWYGGCRFGLAHGPGIYRTGWTFNGVQSVSIYPLRMYYGRAEGPPKPGGSLKPGVNSVALARGVGHDFHEFHVVDDTLDATVQEPNGKFAPDVVAMSTRSDDVGFTQEAVWVTKNNCPTYGTLEKALADQFLPLNRAQIAIIAPICRQALSRLKAERRDGGIGQSSPFDDANYGYYFMVYSSRDTRPRKGNDYDISANVESKFDIQLCPQPTSLTGCEGLWRARQQPFRAKRDALAANYDRLLALDYASREAGFRPLEDALRAKIRAYASRTGRAARASSSADVPAPRRSKKQ